LSNDAHRSGNSLLIQCEQIAFWSWSPIEVSSIFPLISTIPAGQLPRFPSEASVVSGDSPAGVRICQWLVPISRHS